MVDDGGVDEVVVRDNNQVLADGQHLGGQDAHRHHGPEMAVHFDPVADFKGLIECEHERIHDVSEGLLHGQTDDQREHGQRGEQAEQLEAQFVQGQVEAAKPNRGSEKEDDQRVAARNGDGGRVGKAFDDHGNHHLDRHARKRGGQENVRGAEQRVEGDVEVFFFTANPQQRQLDTDQQNEAVKSLGNGTVEVVVPRERRGFDKVENDLSHQKTDDEKNHEGEAETQCVLRPGVQTVGLVNDVVNGAQHEPILPGRPHTCS